MIEFAAGIMLGGSIGAIIMGALVSQAKASVTERLTPVRGHGRITRRPAQHGMFLAANAPAVRASQLLH
jgi:hypothetical protein